jgi:glycosyltransferase involved in cell wall biosynthesis
MNHASEVWVVVPAYNEGEVLEGVVRQLLELGYQVVVIDDGSSDGTWERMARFPIVTLRHICNLGQGAALQTGISYILRHGQARFLVTFDADGQHDPADIARVLAPLRAGTHDVVLGSRFCDGGAAIRITATRRAMLQGGVYLTRLATGMKVTDTHNGLRAFTAASASRLALTQNRMAHASEILLQIARSGARWCEIPVSVAYTAYSVRKGQSLLNAVNILWDDLAGRLR